MRGTENRRVGAGRRHGRTGTVGVPATCGYGPERRRIARGCVLDRLRPVARDCSNLRLGLWPLRCGRTSLRLRVLGDRPRRQARCRVTRTACELVERSQRHSAGQWRDSGRWQCGAGDNRSPARPHLPARARDRRQRRSQARACRHRASRRQGPASGPAHRGHPRHRRRAGADQHDQRPLRAAGTRSRRPHRLLAGEERPAFRLVAGVPGLPQALCAAVALSVRSDGPALGSHRRSRTRPAAGRADRNDAPRGSPAAAGRSCPFPPQAADGPPASLSRSSRCPSPHRPARPTPMRPPTRC